MAKLDESFPGFAALDAAGEATEAKVRKRIADGTLTEIPGIGDGTATKIEEAFNEMDSPARQAADVAAGDVDTSDAAKEAAVTNVDRDGSGKPGTNANVPGKEVTGGGVTADSPRTGAAEAEAQADARNPGQKQAKDNTLGQLLANSRLCFYDDPSGPYVASADDVRVEGNPRIKVLPISITTPHKGMDIRDGDDSYVITEEMDGDNPSDWLKVRSPNTGLALIR